MTKKSKPVRKKRTPKIIHFLLVLLKNKIFIGILAGLLIAILFESTMQATATDEFCDSCHVHPHAMTSWKQSSHVANASGVKVHCVDCHLPPKKGVDYVTEKARLGIRDAWGMITKDTDMIDWEAKSTLEHAKSYTFKKSCLRCHQNLFPMNLSKKGEDAHLYYSQREDELRCINCHLHVGHYSEKAEQSIDFEQQSSAPKELFRSAASISAFENFTETIPGSPVSIDMVAIPGGTFKMGSPESEAFRNANEPIGQDVILDGFFMAKTEITWDAFEAFYKANKIQGRSDTQASDKGMDAITGPTPPYGFPDQGWGKGSRPAITMTHFAATRFCEWLTKITGKTYRLPTEAEWEYACRGGSQTPYFFEGTPKKFSRNTFWNGLFGPDTAGIASYAVYAENSPNRTQPPEGIKANPFGLINMVGNVKEFCNDWYSENPFKGASGVLENPTGPASGKERVVRGGSFKSDAADLRSAARDYTHHDAWMLTDPQVPKSYWWYSDCIDVGFRVVCEWKEN